MWNATVKLQGLVQVGAQGYDLIFDLTAVFLILPVHSKSVVFCTP